MAVVSSRGLELLSKYVLYLVWFSQLYPHFTSPSVIPLHCKVISMLREVMGNAGYLDTGEARPTKRRLSSVTWYVRQVADLLPAWVAMAMFEEKFAASTNRAGN